MATEHEQVERTVMIMFNPRIKHVSLVKRGANQIPWDVVKNQKEEEVMHKVVQALLVPEGVSLDAVKALDGLGEARLDVGKSASGIQVFEQISRDKFAQESLDLVVLDPETKIQAVVGVLKEDGNFVQKMFRPRQTVIAVQDLPSDATKSPRGEDIFGEMYRMEAAVGGILGQEMGDTATKLASVRAVLDNFFAYLDTTFSVMKGEAAKPIVAPKKENEKNDLSDGVQKSEITDAALVIKDLASEGETANETLEIQPDAAKAQEVSEMKSEELTQIVTEAVKAAMDPLTEHITKLEGVAAKMEKIEADVAKMAKMAKSPAQPIVEHQVDDPTGMVARKSDKTAQKADKDVFRGVLFSSITESK